MYYTVTKPKLDSSEAALLFEAFLMVRRRLQQIVVLFLATCRTELHNATGDLIVELMKQAGQRRRVDQSIFDSTKESNLSELDAQIVESLLKSKGTIQLGSAPTFFDFELQFKPDCMALEESIRLSDAEYMKIHPRFFECMSQVMSKPAPVFPTETLRELGFA